MKFISLVLTFTMFVANFSSFSYANNLRIGMDSFMLSNQLGMIKESYKAPVQVKKDKIHLYLIEDAHCNLEVQENIRDIIDGIYKLHKKKVVIGQEGSTKKIDNSLIHKIRNKDAKRKVADYLLENGYITGAELYQIENLGHVDIYGIEDGDLYKKNFKALCKLLEYDRQFDELFLRLRKLLNRAKRIMYSGALKRFEEKEREYTEDKIGQTEYLNYLMNQAKVKKINIKGYENIKKYLKSEEINEIIDLAKVQLETALLMKRLPSGVMGKEGLIGLDFYYFLMNKLDEENIRLSEDFNNLKKYLKYLEQIREIDQREFIYEIEKLKIEIKKAFLENKKNISKVLYVENMSSILKRLIKLEAGYKDYECWKDGNKVFYKEINKLFDGLSYKNFFREKEKLVKEAEKIFTNFYNLAGKRNEIFVNNTLKHASKNPAIIITGGYHTQGIAQILRNKGISYSVITPNIKETKISRKIYLERLKEQREALNLKTRFNSAAPANKLAIMNAYESGVLTDDKFREILAELDIDERYAAIEGLLKFCEKDEAYLGLTRILKEYDFIYDLSTEETIENDENDVIPDYEGLFKFIFRARKKPEEAIKIEGKDVITNDSYHPIDTGKLRILLKQRQKEEEAITDIIDNLRVLDNIKEIFKYPVERKRLNKYLEIWGSSIKTLEEIEKTLIDLLKQDKIKDFIEFLDDLDGLDDLSERLEDMIFEKRELGEDGSCWVYSICYGIISDLINSRSAKNKARKRIIKKLGQDFVLTYSLDDRANINNKMRASLIKAYELSKNRKLLDTELRFFYNRFREAMREYPEQFRGVDFPLIYEKAEEAKDQEEFMTWWEAEGFEYFKKMISPGAQESKRKEETYSRELDMKVLADYFNIEIRIRGDHTRSDINSGAKNGIIYVHYDKERKHYLSMTRKNHISKLGRGLLLDPRKTTVGKYENNIDDVLDHIIKDSGDEFQKGCEDLYKDTKVMKIIEELGQRYGLRIKYIKNGVPILLKKNGLYISPKMIVIMERLDKEDLDVELKTLLKEIVDYLINMSKSDQIDLDIGLEYKYVHDIIDVFSEEIDVIKNVITESTAKKEAYTSPAIKSIDHIVTRLTEIINHERDERIKENASKIIKILNSLKANEDGDGKLMQELSELLGVEGFKELISRLEEDHSFLGWYKWARRLRIGFFISSILMVLLSNPGKNPKAPTELEEYEATSRDGEFGDAMKLVRDARAKVGRLFREKGDLDRWLTHYYDGVYREPYVEEKSSSDNDNKPDDDSGDDLKEPGEIINEEDKGAYFDYRMEPQPSQDTPKLNETDIDDSEDIKDFFSEVWKKAGERLSAIGDLLSDIYRFGIPPKLVKLETVKVPMTEKAELLEDEELAPVYVVTELAGLPKKGKKGKLKKILKALGQKGVTFTAINPDKEKQIFLWAGSHCRTKDVDECLSDNSVKQNKEIELDVIKGMRRKEKGMDSFVQEGFAEGYEMPAIKDEGLNWYGAAGVLKRTDPDIRVFGGEPGNEEYSRLYAEHSKKMNEFYTELSKLETHQERVIHLQRIMEYAQSIDSKITDERTISYLKLADSKGERFGYVSMGGSHARSLKIQPDLCRDLDFGVVILYPDNVIEDFLLIDDVKIVCALEQFSVGKYIEGIEIIKSIDHKSFLVQSILALGYLRKGDDIKADALLKEMLKDIPAWDSNKEFYKKLFFSFMRSGDLYKENVGKLIDRLVKLEPKFANDLYLYAGVTYYNTAKDYYKAIKYFEKVIENRDSLGQDDFLFSAYVNKFHASYHLNDLNRMEEAIHGLAQHGWTPYEEVQKCLRMYNQLLQNPGSFGLPGVGASEITEKDMDIIREQLARESKAYEKDTAAKQGLEQPEQSVKIGMDEKGQVVEVEDEDKEETKLDAEEYREEIEIKESLDDESVTMDEKVEFLEDEEIKGYFEVAEEAMRSGKFKTAVNNLNEILKIDKNNDKARLFRGVCLYKLERYEDARIDFQRVNKESGYKSKAEKYLAEIDEKLALPHVVTELDGLPKKGKKGKLKKILKALGQKGVTFTAINPEKEKQIFLYKGHHCSDPYHDVAGCLNDPRVTAMRELELDMLKTMHRKVSSINPHVEEGENFGVELGSVKDRDLNTKGAARVLKDKDDKIKVFGAESNMYGSAVLNSESKRGRESLYKDFRGLKTNEERVKHLSKMIKYEEDMDKLLVHQRSLEHLKFAADRADQLGYVSMGNAHGLFVEKYPELYKDLDFGVVVLTRDTRDDYLETIIAEAERVQYLYALEEFSASKYSEGIERIETILGNRPNSLGAKLMLGIGYLLKGDDKAADKLFIEVFNKYPIIFENNPNTVNNNLNIRIRQTFYNTFFYTLLNGIDFYEDEIEAAIGRFLKLKPEYKNDLYMFMALLYYKDFGDYIRAFELVDRLSKDADNITSKHFLFNVYLVKFRASQKLGNLKGMEEAVEGLKTRDFRSASPAQQCIREYNEFLEKQKRESHTGPFDFPAAGASVITDKDMERRRKQVAMESNQDEENRAAKAEQGESEEFVEDKGSDKRERIEGMSRSEEEQKKEKEDTRSLETEESFTSSGSAPKSLLVDGFKKGYNAAFKYIDAGLKYILPEGVAVNAQHVRGAGSWRVPDDKRVKVYQIEKENQKEGLAKVRADNEKDMGDIHRSYKMYEKAIESYEKALAMGYDDTAEIYHWLHICYEQTGNSVKASEYRTKLRYAIEGRELPEEERLQRVVLEDVLNTPRDRNIDRSKKDSVFIEDSKVYNKKLPEKVKENIDELKKTGLAVQGVINPDAKLGTVYVYGQHRYTGDENLRVFSNSKDGERVKISQDNSYKGAKKVGTKVFVVQGYLEGVMNRLSDEFREESKEIRYKLMSEIRLLGEEKDIWVVGVEDREVHQEFNSVDPLIEETVHSVKDASTSLEESLSYHRLLMKLMKHNDYGKYQKRIYDRLQKAREVLPGLLQNGYDSIAVFHVLENNAILMTHPELVPSDVRVVLLDSTDVGGKKDIVEKWKVELFDFIACYIARGYTDLPKGLLEDLIEEDKYCIEAYLHYGLIALNEGNERQSNRNFQVFLDKADEYTYNLYYSFIHRYLSHLNGLPFIVKSKDYVRKVFERLIELSASDTEVRRKILEGIDEVTALYAGSYGTEDILKVTQLKVLREDIQNFNVYGDEPSSKHFAAAAEITEEDMERIREQAARESELYEENRAARSKSEQPEKLVKIEMDEQAKMESPEGKYPAGIDERLKFVNIVTDSNELPKKGKKGKLKKILKPLQQKGVKFFAINPEKKKQIFLHKGGHCRRFHDIRECLRDKNVAVMKLAEFDMLKTMYKKNKHIYPYVEEGVPSGDELDIAKEEILTIAGAARVLKDSHPEIKVFGAEVNNDRDQELFIEAEEKRKAFQEKFMRLKTHEEKKEALLEMLAYEEKLNEIIVHENTIGHLEFAAEKAEKFGYVSMGEGHGIFVERYPQLYNDLDFGVVVLTTEDSEPLINKKEGHEETIKHIYALEQFSVGKYEEGIEILESILEYMPMKAVTRLILGVGYLLKGDDNKANRIFEEIFQDIPPTFENLTFYDNFFSDFLIGGEAYKDSLDRMFKRFVKLHSEWEYNLYFCIGLSYYKDFKEYSKSIEFFEKLTENSEDIKDKRILANAYNYKFLASNAVNDFKGMKEAIDGFKKDNLLNYKSAHKCFNIYNDLLKTQEEGIQDGQGSAFIPGVGGQILRAPRLYDNSKKEGLNTETIKKEHPDLSDVVDELAPNVLDVRVIDATDSKDSDMTFFVLRFDHKHEGDTRTEEHKIIHHEKCVEVHRTLYKYGHNIILDKEGMPKGYHIPAGSPVSNELVPITDPPCYYFKQNYGDNTVLIGAEDEELEDEEQNIDDEYNRLSGLISPDKFNNREILTTLKRYLEVSKKYDEFIIKRRNLSHLKELKSKARSKGLKSGTIEIGSDHFKPLDDDYLNEFKGRVVVITPKGYQGSSEMSVEFRARDHLYVYYRMNGEYALAVEHAEKMIDEMRINNTDQTYIDIYKFVVLYYNSIKKDSSHVTSLLEEQLELNGDSIPLPEHEEVNSILSAAYLLSADKVKFLKSMGKLSILNPERYPPGVNEHSQHFDQNAAPSKRNKKEEEIKMDPQKSEISEDDRVESKDETGEEKIEAEEENGSPTEVRMTEGGLKGGGAEEESMVGEKSEGLKVEGNDEKEKRVDVPRYLKNIGKEAASNDMNMEIRNAEVSDDGVLYVVVNYNVNLRDTGSEIQNRADRISSSNYNMVKHLDRKKRINTLFIDRTMYERPNCPRSDMRKDPFCVFAGEKRGKLNIETSHKDIPMIEEQHKLFSQGVLDFEYRSSIGELKEKVKKVKRYNELGTKRYSGILNRVNKKKDNVAISVSMLDLKSFIEEYEKMYAKGDVGKSLVVLCHEEITEAELSMSYYENVYELWLDLGTRYYEEKKDYRSAIKYIEEGLEIEPNNIPEHQLVEAYLVLSKAYKGLKDSTKTKEYYYKASKLDPDNAEILMVKGRSFYKKKKYEKARGYFDKVPVLSRQKEDANEYLKKIGEKLKQEVVIDERSKYEVHRERISEIRDNEYFDSLIKNIEAQGAEAFAAFNHERLKDGEPFIIFFQQYHHSDDSRTDFHNSGKTIETSFDLLSMLIDENIVNEFVNEGYTKYIEETGCSLQNLYDKKEDCLNPLNAIAGHYKGKVKVYGAEDKRLLDYGLEVFSRSIKEVDNSKVEQLKERVEYAHILDQTVILRTRRYLEFANKKLEESGKMDPQQSEISEDDRKVKPILIGLGHGHLIDLYELERHGKLPYPVLAVRVANDGFLHDDSEKSGKVAYSTVSNNVKGLVDLYFKQKRSDLAIELVEETIDREIRRYGKDFKPLASYYQILAVAYGDMGVYDKVIESANKSIDLRPEDPYAYFYLGKAYQNIEGKEREMTEAFKKTLELEPNISYASEIRRLLGDMQPESQEVLNAKISEDYSKNYLDLIEKSYEDKDYNLVIRLADLYLQNNEDKTEDYILKKIYLVAGKAHKELGDYNTSRQMSNKVLGIDRLNSGARFLRAECYYYLGNFDQALADFKKLKGSRKYKDRAREYLDKIENKKTDSVKVDLTPELTEVEVSEEYKYAQGLVVIYDKSTGRVIRKIYLGRGGKVKDSDNNELQGILYFDKDGKEEMYVDYKTNYASGDEEKYKIYDVRDINKRRDIGEEITSDQYGSEKKIRVERNGLVLDFWHDGSIRPVHIRVENKEQNSVYALDFTNPGKLEEIRYYKNREQESVYRAKGAEYVFKILAETFPFISLLEEGGYYIGLEPRGEEEEIKDHGSAFFPGVGGMMTGIPGSEDGVSTSAGNRAKLFPADLLKRVFNSANSLLSYISPDGVFVNAQAIEDRDKADKEDNRENEAEEKVKVEMDEKGQVVEFEEEIQERFMNAEYSLNNKGDLRKICQDIETGARDLNKDVKEFVKEFPELKKLVKEYFKDSEGEDRRDFKFNGKCYREIEYEDGLLVVFELDENGELGDIVSTEPPVIDIEILQALCEDNELVKVLKGSGLKAWWTVFKKITSDRLAETPGIYRKRREMFKDFEILQIETTYKAA